MIHYARLDKSARLMAFLRFLQVNRQGATTRQIQDQAGVCNPNTAAAELRRQGYPVTCRFTRTTDEGKRIYTYRLEAMGKKNFRFDKTKKGGSAQ
jgi:hypothetical protein